MGGSTYEPEPDKYMIYQMKKVKDGYNILSIKSLDTWEAEQQSGVENSQNVTTQRRGGASSVLSGINILGGLWLPAGLIFADAFVLQKSFHCFLQKSRKRFAFFLDNLL